MEMNYKQKTEKVTKVLLERALNYLVETKPEYLNGKKIKKITLSYSQIINAMHELADREEIAAHAIISSSSTFSHNKEYKAMITKARIALAESLLDDNGFKIPQDRTLSVIEYKLAIQQLMFDNDNLKRKNVALESYIEQAEIQSTIQDNQPLINDLQTNSNTHEKLLSFLLELLSKDSIVYIKPKQTGIPMTIWYEGINGQVKLCNAEEIATLPLSFKKNKLNILEIEASNG